MIEPLTLTDNDVDAAVRTVYGEARGEPFEGQVAVAWVIRNRATWQPPAWWGHTVETVCYKPFQFSCHNANDPNRKLLDSLPSNNLAYTAIENGVVKPVMGGFVQDPTNGATMYKVRGTKASWDNAVIDMEPVSIGHHDFYRLPPDA